MKRLIIFITILTVGCSTEKKPTDKNFADLTQDEKTELFSGLGDELIGDFIKYSGQVTSEDSTKTQTLGPPIFVELVMDKDSRFAIRTKFIESEVKNDTATFHFMGMQSNKGTGKWSDLGDKFELKFQMGTVDSFFDEKNNKGKIEVVDNYTLRFDKAVDEIWIWKTPCKK
jgi:hypothetical protein